MISRLLVANRGEIAVRIIRTAADMNISTVAVVSEADTDSLWARAADAVVVLGPPPAGASYLNQDAILDAAASSGADAVHPGYGFLSENADFARRVLAAGLTWVGPSPEAIELMGNKARAREAAEAAGVPVIAGTSGPLRPDEDAVAAARRIGYPLVVKASAGGGGRGIRLVTDEADLLTTIETARGEAAAIFGDPAVYLEQFIEAARHIEVQVLGDGRDYVHLGDRDCSMQRRSQKVLEEAPAPNLPDHVRETIRTSSVRLAASCGYLGAGTVEFLYDPVRQEAAFIEMNTRLQVEHPITEEITGIDLVREQLVIASGGGISFRQDELEFSGHAIECRINAEDPARNFMPSPGTVAGLQWPEGDGVRIDSGFGEGSVIPPFYDSLIAKVIVHGQDREDAVSAMSKALGEAVVEGVSTTIPLHLRLLEAPEFAAAGHHTKYIESTPAILEGL